jgi:hypothetical protein
VIIEGDPRVGVKWSNEPIPGISLPFRARWRVALSLVRVALSVLANRRWTQGHVERAGPPWMDEDKPLTIIDTYQSIGGKAQ